MPLADEPKDGPHEQQAKQQREEHEAEDRVRAAERDARGGSRPDRDPGTHGRGVRPLSTGFTGNPGARIEPMGSFGQGERGLAGYEDSGQSEVFTMPPGDEVEES